MSKKKIIYDGNDLLKLDFGLYNADENIDDAETKKNIKRAFSEQYTDTLKDVLAQIGLEFHGFEYHSPKYYNFKTDSLDCVISLVDKKVFRKYILKYKDKINSALAKNSSYDGYISKTVCDVEREVWRMKEKDHYGGIAVYEPDILVLSTILYEYIDLSDFKVSDYYIYTTEYLEEEEIEELEKEITESWNKNADEIEVERIQNEIDEKESDISYYVCLNEENKVEVD